MIRVEPHEFERQTDCVYHGERYSVRDSGAVLRHSRDGKRARPLDGLWTFGKPNNTSGYMQVASEVVHRIVATAFLGDPPSKSHVVDHIDTNRRNNRPENLRWVTKLENILTNPITAKRVILAYGSIEAFLADPSSPRFGHLGRNLDWMRTVTRKEAEISRERLLAWAASKSAVAGGSLGDWLFRRGDGTPDDEAISKATKLINAITPDAVQRNWKTPTEFPCCPAAGCTNPISAYARRLTTGETFARSKFSDSKVVSVALSQDQQVLWVLCDHGEEAIKQWSLAQVSFEGLFVHESQGSFFSIEGAQKRYCLAQGLEWTGGDTIDDCC